MKHIALTLLLTALSAPVFAQALSVIESKKIDITVGSGDFSIIDLNGRKVMHVDVDYQKCELATERSKTIGKVVFKPASDKPFTMFVTDNFEETYTINVSVDKNKKPDLFTVKNLAAEQRKSLRESAQVKYANSTIRAINLSAGHKRVILDLVKAMALGDTPSNANIQNTNRIVPLWNETEIISLKEYTIGNLVGAVYEIKNIDSKEMVLDEREFYSLHEKTLGISVERPKLMPNEKTFMYIVASK